MFQCTFFVVDAGLCFSFTLNGIMKGVCFVLDDDDDNDECNQLSFVYLMTLNKQYKK